MNVNILVGKSLIFLVSLAIMLPILSPQRINAESLPSAKAKEAALSPFDEVWQKVYDHFYDPRFSGIDWKAMGEKYRLPAAQAKSADALAETVNRMLAELKTSHTRLYTKTEPEYYQLLAIFSKGPMGEEIRRLFPDGKLHYPGIGVFTREVGGRTFISGVLEGSPAHVAGLRIGDRIISVDRAVYRSIDSFAGRTGRMVKVAVQPTQDPKSVREVTVVPEEIDPSDVFLKAMKESVRVIEQEGRKIGYVHVWSYAGEQYHELLTGEIAFGRLKDADALILDLRDGWGGANPVYLNLFNPKVPVLTNIDRSGKKTDVDFQWRKPVAMLVNGGTRSGKEILAYGFKKYGIGKVIGTRTAGAVIGGRPFLLQDGSLLYLASVGTLVDGEQLEGKGVAPDIEIHFPLEYAQGKDPQIARAVRELLKEIK
ncbi:MAG: periplasmic [Geobacteraceae bacterium]|nr:MAG: periplasmic [Geobacteraceae bacterium]